MEKREPARGMDEHIFWLQAVHSLLRCQYERSQRKHVVAFLGPGVAFADSALDGQGGSALLTELHYHLGKEVLIRRDFFKRLVLISARSLGWPLQCTPTGSVSLGFRPRPRPRNKPRRTCPGGPSILGE